MAIQDMNNLFRYTIKDNGNFKEVEIGLKTGYAFKPTSTSNMLLKSADINKGDEVIEMGCGVAGLSIAIAKYLPVRKVYAVDKQKEACELARENVKMHNLSDKIEVIHSDLFKELNGIKANVIINDVSGIANYGDFARKTVWYSGNEIPVASEDGSYPTTEMLEQAPKHLKKNGSLYFPVLSLAKESIIMEKAKSVFKDIKRLEEYAFPITKHCFNIDFKEARSLLEKMMENGMIRLDKYGSRYKWLLGIYEAHN